MSTSLDLSMDQRADGTWVMTAAGEIDMSNAGAFGEGLALARAKAGDGPGALVVDLRAVEYLDTAGLTALFAYAPEVELIASPLLGPRADDFRPGRPGDRARAGRRTRPLVAQAARAGRRARNGAASSRAKKFMKPSGSGPPFMVTRWSKPAST